MPDIPKGAKENRQPVDERDILERLARIPIQTWNYKSDPAVRHIGPMAQDFFAEFGVGDDKHIYSVDATGVAFGAIKALYEILREQRAEAQRLGKQLDQIESESAQLKTELAAWETLRVST